MKNPKNFVCLIVLLVCCQFISYSQSGDSKIWLKGWRGKTVTLYQFCNNSLQVEGTNHDGKKFENLSFSAINATITKSTKEGLVNLYPLDNGNEVVLAVSENGIFIDSLVMQIVEVPTPKIMIRYNNEVVNLEEGISLKGFTMGNLKVEIVRDDLWILIPKDTRFIFSDAKITLARKTEAVSVRAINFLGESDIFTLIAQAKPRDRLLIEVPELIRIDSQANAHRIKFGTIYTIPLHDIAK